MSLHTTSARSSIETTTLNPTFHENNTFVLMSTGLHNTEQPPFMNLNIYDTPWNGMKAVSAKKKRQKEKIKEKTQKQIKERKKPKTYKQQILTSLYVSLFLLCFFNPAISL